MTHNDYPVVIRPADDEYQAAKELRAIHDVNDLSHLHHGLRERLEVRLRVLEAEIRYRFGTWFEPYLVSSWVDGAGIDAQTEHEEPGFWELKKRAKTWDGRYPRRFKLSDFDINIYTKETDKPLDVRGMVKLEDANGKFKVHIYPSKGERRVLLNIL